MYCLIKWSRVYFLPNTKVSTYVTAKFFWNLPLCPKLNYFTPTLDFFLSCSFLNIDPLVILFSYFHLLFNCLLPFIFWRCQICLNYHKDKDPLFRSYVTHSPIKRLCLIFSIWALWKHCLQCYVLIFNLILKPL